MVNDVLKKQENWETPSMEGVALWMSSASTKYVWMLQPLVQSAEVARNVVEKMGVFDSYSWNSDSRINRWPEGLEWVPYLLNLEQSVPVLSQVDGVLYVAGFPVDEVFVRSVVRDVASLTRKFCASYLLESVRSESSFLAASMRQLRWSVEEKNTRHALSINSLREEMREVSRKRELLRKQESRFSRYVASRYIDGVSKSQT